MDRIHWVDLCNPQFLAGWIDVFNLPFDPRVEAGRVGLACGLLSLSLLSSSFLIVHIVHSTFGPLVALCIHAQGTNYMTRKKKKSIMR